MPNRQSVTLSDFYCTNCGKKGIPIARRKGAQREPGHLKKLYCLNCGREINHVEVRPFGEYDKEDFYIEFKNHNFDEEGLRLIPYKQLLAEARKRGEYNE